MRPYGRRYTGVGNKGPRRLMEELLPVPAGARAAVRQTLHGCGSHAAPPNQCWPPCTECRCVDEILPVNIAGGREAGLGDKAVHGAPSCTAPPPCILLAEFRPPTVLGGRRREAVLKTGRMDHGPGLARSLGRAAMSRTQRRGCSLDAAASGLQPLSLEAAASRLQP